MTTQAPTVTGKAILRKEMIARRDALPEHQRVAAAKAIASRLFPVDFAAGAVVSGFSPLASEIDPRPLMQKLARQRAQLALPVVAGRGLPLVFRAWSPGDALVAGGWGIQVPKDDALVVEPDVLIVPLLAFDRRGHRLGYGAGYYDLSLTALRAKKGIVAVGIGFATQEVAEIPISPRDARLDLMLTEQEIIDFRDQ
jgi:5-formyltetrahydrofolate cyclo-ligase